MKYPRLRHHLVLFFAAALACSSCQGGFPSPAPSWTPRLDTSLPVSTPEQLLPPPTAAQSPTLSPFSRTTPTPSAATLIQRLGKGTLADIALHPEGSLLAGAGNQGIWIWDAVSLALQKHITLPDSALSALAWDPQGDRLVCGTHSGALYLVEIDSGAVQSREQTASGIQSLAWSPDGRWIAVHSSLSSSGASREEAVFLWHPASGVISVFLSAADLPDSAPFSVSGISWSPDSSRLAAATYSGTVNIKPVDPAAELRSLEISDQTFSAAQNLRVEDLAWGPAGEQIAVSLSDPSRAKDPPSASAASMTLIFHLDEDDKPEIIPELAGASFAWSSRGDMALITPSGISILIEETSEQIPIPLPHAAADLTWSPTGERLLIKSGGAEFSIWNLQNRSLVHHQLEEFYQRGIHLAGWSPHGEYLAALGDGRVTVWSSQVGYPHRETISGINTFAWSPTHSQLALITQENKLLLKSLEDPPRSTQPTMPFEHSIHSLSWSPQGNLLALQYEGTHAADPEAAPLSAGILLWDVAGEKELSHLKIEDEAVLASVPPLLGRAAWSPDGTLIAVGTSLGQLLIWDTDSGELLQGYKTHHSFIPAAEWTFENSSILTGSWDGGVKIVNPATGAILSARDQLPGFVHSLDWSEKHGWAAAAVDNEIIIMETRQLDIIDRLGSHEGIFFSVSWAPEQNILAAASGMGSVLIFKIPLSP